MRNSKKVKNIDEFIKESSKGLNKVHKDRLVQFAKNVLSYLMETRMGYYGNSDFQELIGNELNTVEHVMAEGVNWRLGWHHFESQFYRDDIEPEEDFECYEAFIDLDTSFWEGWSMMAFLEVYKSFGDDEINKKKCDELMVLIEDPGTNFYKIQELYSR